MILQRFFKAFGISVAVCTGATVFVSVMPQIMDWSIQHGGAIAGAAVGIVTMSGLAAAVWTFCKS